jgi:hypothetical protein
MDAMASINIAAIVARLVRAIVVGPIARLELLPLDASTPGSGDIIEAQIAHKPMPRWSSRKAKRLC